MKIITFSDGQGSKEWLEWRRNGIGASDISILQGSNKFKTLLELWDEKCGFKAPDPPNFAMEHGIRNEEKARKWINENHNLNLEPLCIENIESSYFKASLDGYDSEKKVICEIKCPVSEEILNKVREHRNIPLYWEHQVQWQIFLANPMRSFIGVWDPREEKCITIEVFSKPSLQTEMKEKAEEFWRTVKLGIPPVPSEKDYIHIEDEKLECLLHKYKDHDGVEKAAILNKKNLKKKIVEFGDDGNFTCAGFFISRRSPRVTYDIEQMRKDGIAVDEYIKKNNGIGYYRISCPKD